MNFKTSLIVALFFIGVLCQSPKALAFINGYDGHYQAVNPNMPVRLVDDKGANFSLRDGFYRVRNTNKKSSIIFMPDSKTYQIVPIRTGFLDGILDNYHVDGRANGLEVDIDAQTRDFLVREWPSRTQEECNYYCGTDYCGRQVYCYGYEEIERRNQEFNRRYKMDFTDNTLAHMGILGTFNANLGNHVNSWTTWSSGCRATRSAPIGSCPQQPIPPRPNPRPNPGPRPPRG